jgi:16S rRNA processing protein RimM
MNLIKIRPHKDGLIAELKGVVDRNHSETLRKSAVYIPEAALQAEPGEAIYLQQILGFTLVDVSQNVLGEVVGFATNGAQDLLRVKPADQAEFLVPFIEQFLVKIDFDKRQVSMDLPPGLAGDEEE